MNLEYCHIPYYTPILGAAGGYWGTLLTLTNALHTCFPSSPMPGEHTCEQAVIIPYSLILCNY